MTMGCPSWCTLRHQKSGIACVGEAINDGNDGNGVNVIPMRYTDRRPYDVVNVDGLGIDAEDAETLAETFRKVGANGVADAIRQAAMILAGG